MICKYCGSSIPDGSNRCDYCGGVFDNNNQQVYENNSNPNFQQNNFNQGGPNYAQNNYQGNYQNSNSNKGEGTGALAIISLVLGCFSIISCCSGTFALILGVLAIVLACFEKRKSGIKKAGLITGIIGTLLCLITVGIMIVGKGFINENLEQYLEGLVEEYGDSDEYQEFLKELENSDEYKDLINEFENYEQDNKKYEDSNTSSSSSSDWTKQELKDSKYEITYKNGIADSYMLSEKGSFKNLCEWLNYAMPGYPTETFRQVFSVFFQSSDHYKTMMSKIDDDQKELLLAGISSLAWQINNDFGGKVVGCEYNANSADIVTFTIDSSMGTIALQWDITNATLKFGDKTTGKLTDYSTMTFDTNRLATIMVAVSEALKGEKAG